MGLDIALGLFVLVGAIRGWFRGFLSQAIRLGGLLVAVFAAAPVRDLAKPYVIPYLSSVHPSVLDRLLWWSAAVLIYVVGVGLVTSAVKFQKRRTLGEPEPNRTDQIAGMWVGALKAAVYLLFILSSFQRHGLEQARKLTWFDEQARTSRSLELNTKYQPADRIWSSVPVQLLVAHVKKNGILSPEEAAGGVEAVTPGEKVAPVQADNGRTPRLDLPRLREQGLDPNSPEFLENLDTQLREFEAKFPR